MHQKTSGRRTGRSAGQVILFLLFLLLLSIPSFATEGGGGAYPNGAEGFMSGAVPPPGYYFINYMTYYDATKFDDGAGENMIPDFHVRVAANVFRFLYVSKVKILGANWAMHAIIPILHVDIKLPNASQHKAGIGDILLDPFVLAWHWKNVHAAAGLETFLPTGSFKKTDAANLGSNYWTFEPAAAVTYLSDSGFELSTKVMYDINTENNDTDYRAGDEFHFDYTIAKHFNNFALGVGGYYYKQVTNDEQNGETVEPDGNKGRVFAIGPQAKYDYKNMIFVLKYQKETNVENRPEGNKYWFKFYYTF